MEDFSFVDSKLERAIAAYLISAACGSVNDVLPSISIAVRKFPLTDIFSVNATPDPKFSGNYRIQLWISIKGSAVIDPKETNPQAKVVEFQKRVKQTWDALMQSDNDQDLSLTAELITAAGRDLAVDHGGSAEETQRAQNNADMVNFTCLEWLDAGFGHGKAEEDGCDWERVLLFTALACSENVD